MSWFLWGGLMFLAVITVIGGIVLVMGFFVLAIAGKTAKEQEQYEQRIEEAK